VAALPGAIGKGGEMLQQFTRHKRFLVLTGLALLLSGGALLYAFPQVGRVIEPTCTVGLTATTTTITIVAWSAHDDCDRLVHGKTNFLGSPVPAGSIYATNPAPYTLCELDIQNRHLIVRDRNLNLVGSGECELLRLQGQE
jgi:hypothetical protein